MITSLNNLETVNVLEQFNLYNPEKVDIFRLNNGQFLPLIELNEDEIKTFVKVLIAQSKLLKRKIVIFYIKLRYF